jgi:ABC-type transport system involved in multi-copper enzyme maturation permease subunit
MNAIKLIKLEILKYKDNSLVQMLLLFFTLLMPTSIFVLKNFDKIPFIPGKESFFTFPLVWEYQAYAGSWLSFLFLGFLGVYLITSEIQYKTMRQNIITGLSRFDFFMGKILITFIVTLYATIIFYLSTLLIGILHEGEINIQHIFNQQNYVILRFFLLTFAYMTFGMLVAFIIRKPALSIFFYFSYILFIEPLFRWWIHLKFINKGRSMLYYPLNGIEDLAPLPFYKYVENFNNLKDFPILLSYTEASVISVISVIVFVSLSYYLFIKRDI